jgi:hypothetical protein
VLETTATEAIATDDFTFHSTLGEIHRQSLQGCGAPSRAMTSPWADQRRLRPHCQNFRHSGGALDRFETLPPARLAS